MKNYILALIFFTSVLVSAGNFSSFKNIAPKSIAAAAESSYKKNVGCQKCCDPKKAVSKDQIGSSWYSAIDFAYYEEARSLRKPLREMTIEELRNEFDLWYFELGWKFHLDEYGWAGYNGTIEYYHYDPWSQECWDYTVRKYQKPVGPYDNRRAIACDTVRVEIAMLQTIHCLINCKVRKNLPNAR